jgi:hypothetical protein
MDMTEVEALFLRLTDLPNASSRHVLLDSFPTNTPLSSRELGRHRSCPHDTVVDVAAIVEQCCRLHHIDHIYRIAVCIRKKIQIQKIRCELFFFARQCRFDSSTEEKGLKSLGGQDKGLGRMRKPRINELGKYKGEKILQSTHPARVGRRICTKKLPS